MKGAGDSLYRNNGDGTFTDVSEKAGVADLRGYYGMGVAWGDFDNDGDADLYVANDTNPNYLYWNQGDGTFREAGLLSGAAVDPMGRPAQAWALRWATTITTEASTSAFPISPEKLTRCIAIRVPDSSQIKPSLQASPVDHPEFGVGHFFWRLRQ